MSRRRLIVILAIVALVLHAVVVVIGIALGDWWLSALSAAIAVAWILWARNTVRRLPRSESPIQDGAPSAPPPE
jgi:hypothetical protein